MDIKPWAVGFIDGEGSLQISSRKSGSGRTYHFPRFTIQVRADDKGAIDKVITAIGIRPYMAYRKPSDRTWNTKRTIQVTWQSKKQLVVLVSFFDQYPLQSKKAREYPYWKKAVNIFCAGTIDYDAREQEMLQLKERIQRERRYEQG